MSHLKANRRARVYANKGVRVLLGATDWLVLTLVIKILLLLLFFFSKQRPCGGSHAEVTARPERSSKLSVRIS